MTDIKCTNGAIVPLEKIPASVALHKTKLAKAIGPDNTAKLQAVLDTTPNRRWAYFWAKYAHLASVASINKKNGGAAGFHKSTNQQNPFGGYISEGITINIAENAIEGNKFEVLIHEVTHNIDNVISQYGFTHIKHGAKGKFSNLAYAELEINGEKVTLFDAIAKDCEYWKEQRKTAYKGYSVKQFRDTLAGVYTVKGYKKLDGTECRQIGYDLPIMVLGGEGKNLYHEMLAAMVEFAITQPKLFDELKGVISNVVGFFEKLIEYLTPEYNANSGYVVTAKFKFNARGKLLISFNNKYSIADMLQRLQSFGGLSFKAAYSVIMRAVINGKASASTLEIDDTVNDYDTANHKIKQMAAVIISQRQAA